MSRSELVVQVVKAWALRVSDDDLFQSVRWDEVQGADGRWLFVTVAGPGDGSSVEVIARARGLVQLLAASIELAIGPDAVDEDLSSWAVRDDGVTEEELAVRL